MKKIYFSFAHDDSKAREVLSSLRSKCSTMGYEPISAEESDARFEPGRLTSEFIKQASLVIGFFREQSAHVVYELGYSIGLGKKVILVADLAGDLPWDLKTVDAIDYRGAPTEIVFEIMRRIDKIEASGWASEAVLPERLADMLHLKSDRPELFELISSEAFENAVKTAFIERGFTVTEADPTEDYGFDFRIIDATRQKSVPIEVKKFNPNSKVSIAAIQQLLGAVHAYHDTAGLLICTSDFTHSARGFAARYGGEISLWTARELEDFCSGRVKSDQIDDLLSLGRRRIAGN